MATIATSKFWALNSISSQVEMQVQKMYFSHPYRKNIARISPSALYIVE